MANNSSRKNAGRTLAMISAARAQEFLSEVANIRDEGDGHRFMHHFGSIVRPEMPNALIQQWALRGEEEDIGDLSSDQRIWKYWLAPLRDSVQRLWIGNERDKSWGVISILAKYFLIGSRIVQGPLKT